MVFKQIKQGIIAATILFGTAIVAITIAALWQRPDRLDAAAQRYAIPGSKLQTVMGRSSVTGGAIKLLSLQDGVAVISSGQLQLSTSLFPFVTLRLTGLDNLLTVDLFWRERGKANTVYTERIYHYDSGSLTLHLSNNENWGDEITEFGISVQGQLRQPLIIESIRLEPWSVSAWANAVWDQWWAYGGWKGTSVNFISGGSYDKMQKIPPPDVLMVPAIAVWLGLSVGLYLLAVWLLAIKVDWYWPLAMFLLAWLILDSRWLHELWRRTQFTQYQYSGKTQHQKWLNETDNQWYMMVQQLKQHIPEQSARIFQVLKTRKPLDNYYRYRVRYHLLPHNVFPYLHTLPENSHIKHGDYILDLGEMSNIHYNDKTRELVDTSSKSSKLHNVILKYQSRLGRLYQFLGK